MNRFLKARYGFWLRLLIVLVAVTVMAQQGTLLFLRLSHPATVQMAFVSPLQSQRVDGDALPTLLGLDWWGKADAASSGLHQETSLPLTLQGVFLDQKNHVSSALILRSGSPSPQLFHVGDDLGGGVLAGITAEWVQIRRPDGRVESLKLHPDQTRLLIPVQTISTHTIKPLE